MHVERRRHLKKNEFVVQVVYTTWDVHEIHFVKNCRLNSGQVYSLVLVCVATYIPEE